MTSVVRKRAAERLVDRLAAADDRGAHLRDPEGKPVASLAHSGAGGDIGAMF